MSGFFFYYYYCSESVSGIVCVFVVLVLERVRRWVCGLRCPADLSGHMRSICEVSRSVSVHTLQAARQLLARIVGKVSRKRFATQPLCFHVRKIFNVHHFRQCIKDNAVFGESGSQKTPCHKQEVTPNFPRTSVNLPSLCHGRLELIMCMPPGHFGFTRALVLRALSPKQH